jgi:putative transposase
LLGIFRRFAIPLREISGLDALVMALWRRRPVQKVIIHSDQGSQYGSDDWRRFLKANNLEASMSRRGNCWDNAIAESFFSSLKMERIKKRIYKTRDLARADVLDYIESFYNRTRRLLARWRKSRRPWGSRSQSC